MKHVVMYSGGVASWMEAKLTIEKHGLGETVLLFCDTQHEDEDLYRFLHEGAERLKAELQIITAGSLFGLMRKEKTLSNDRMPFCSRKLKVQPAQRWLKKNHPNAIVHVGLYQDEKHRLESVRRQWGGIALVESLLSETLLVNQDIFVELEKLNINKPRLYDMGFPHNNCGGGCVRAGKTVWLNLLEKMPERYQQWEDLEQEIGQVRGRKVSFIRKMVGGIRYPYTLKDLRLNIPAEQLTDTSGCGCFISDEQS